MKKKAQFQYRKRYGLHAIAGGSSQLREFPRFNTASGMDCMQYSSVDVMAPIPGVSIPQAVWIACNEVGAVGVGGRVAGSCFNTASGMDCMQSPRSLCFWL